MKRLIVGITGASGTGKTDFNFLTDGPPFDGFDWKQRRHGQPFFAQISINESHKGQGWTYARSKDSPVGHVDAATGGVVQRVVGRARPVGATGP